MFGLESQRKLHILFGRLNNFIPIYICIQAYIYIWNFLSIPQSLKHYLTDWHKMYITAHIHSNDCLTRPTVTTSTFPVVFPVQLVLVCYCYNYFTTLCTVLVLFFFHHVVFIIVSFLVCNLSHQHFLNKFRDGNTIQEIKQQYFSTRCFLANSNHHTTLFNLHKFTNHKTRTKNEYFSQFECKFT